MQRPSKSKGVRVGVVDSGVDKSPEFANSIIACCDFSEFGDSETRGPAECMDQIGHGSDIARLILAHSGCAMLVVARVFGQTYDVDVGNVCRALEWLMSYDVDIVNMSLGTKVYSKQFEDRCKELAERGVLLICSSPARGAEVFPAAFCHSVAVSGDARCGPNEWSWLDRPTAILGANPLLKPGNPRAGGGASYAAARVSGFAAKLLAEGVERRHLLQAMHAQCAYFGREIRSDTFFD